MKTQIITNLFITILLLASFTNEARMKKWGSVGRQDYPYYMFEGEWKNYMYNGACWDEELKTTKITKVKFTTDYSNCDFLTVKAVRSMESECVDVGHENLSFIIPRERYDMGLVYPMQLISGTVEKPQSVSSSVFFRISSCNSMYVFENKEIAKMKLDVKKALYYFARTDLIGCSKMETFPNSSVPCTPAEPEPNTADPENHCEDEVEIPDQIQMTMKNHTYDYQLSSDSNSGGEGKSGNSTVPLSGPK